MIKTKPYKTDTQLNPSSHLLVIHLSNSMSTDIMYLTCVLWMTDVTWTLEVSHLVHVNIDQDMITSPLTYSLSVNVSAIINL